ncbi:MAG: hypothetical protein GPJ54_06910 [Candidatus Heimdallarchaeota archaeon]|nr:hypothetical protein [Candidatus Heimdallarchaeota archaeon]
MSSASSSVSRKKGKRGITRRVRDEHGNIRVVKYQRKGSRLSIPGLTWGKVPSLLLGIPLSAYAGLLYSNSKGYLSEDGLGNDILGTTDEMSAAVRLILTGTIGMVLTLFMGYSLIRKGFKIRKYPGATREIVAMWAALIVLTAIFSPFINEPGLIRQQSDDEFIVNTNDYDVSGLDSPFYSEFLNGLLDLLGNIPEPKEQVALITPNDGGTFDYDVDRYLYRWRVAETYDPGLADFDQAYTSTQLEYIDSTNVYNTRDPAEEGRALSIKEQYLTISTSYIGDALVPWNSKYGGMIGGLDSVTAEIDEGFTGDLIDTSVGGYRDINEQPALSMAFTDSRTTGFAEYDSFFVKDDKEFIADNAIKMSDLSTQLGRYDLNQDASDRFGDLSQANAAEISGIWGLQSLPGGAGYFDGSHDNDDAFVSKYNDYKAILDNNPDISVYDFTLLIYNDVQNAVIQGLLDGSFNIDPTQTSGVADPGLDKAYWFYDALVDPQVQYGMKELLAGFVNMLRSFDIPARPIIGFSIGDFLKDGAECTGSDCDTISILFQHIHVWLEVLIPVDDGSGVGYQWGVFNPVPDPWILSNDASDFAFGTNSLGGTPNIEVQITSGDDSALSAALDLGGLGTTSDFKTNKKGQDLEGRVRITYDGTPSAGQTIQLKLLTEADLISGNIDPGVGIDLPSIITDDTDGWGNFKLFVDTDGLAYTYNENDVRNSTAIPNLNITDVNPLATQGSYGIYAILAVYSLSFNGTLVGWELNSDITLTANVTSTVIINPNTLQPITSYGALFGSTVEFTVQVRDNDTLDPISDISNVDFLLLSESDYGTLVTALNQQVLNPTLISDNKIGTFSITDINGFATIDVAFDSALEADYPANEVYLALALIQAGFKYNKLQVFVWFEKTLTISTLMTNSSGLPVIDDLSFQNGMVDNNPINWNINSTATAFDNPLNQVFPNEPGVGVTFTYIIMDELTYNTATGNSPQVDYQNLEALFTNPSCSSTPTLPATCYNLNVNGANIAGIDIFGDGETGADGIAYVNITMQNIAFKEGYYYFIIVSEENESFATTVRFFAVASAAPPLFLNNIDIIGNPAFNDLSSNDDGHDFNTFYKYGVIITTLMIFSLIGINNISRRTWRR